MPRPAGRCATAPRPCRHDRRADTRLERVCARSLRRRARDSQPGVRARQPGHPRQLSGNRHAGAGQKGPGDLAQRDVARDALAKRIGEAADGKRPQIRELRQVYDLARHHDHGGLQFVQRAGEGGPVAHARVLAQVDAGHFPLAAQHVQDALGIAAQPPLLVAAANAPHGVEVRNHPRREKERSSARELSVIDAAAPHELVLQDPGERRFRIFLDVTRHDRITASADRHVE